MDESVATVIENQGRLWLDQPKSFLEGVEHPSRNYQLAAQEPKVRLTITLIGIDGETCYYKLLRRVYAFALASFYPKYSRASIQPLVDQIAKLEVFIWGDDHVFRSRILALIRAGKIWHEVAEDFGNELGILLLLGSSRK